MTQPKIDWEAAGRLAGQAEKNTAPGLVTTRPRDWRPNSGQLARSHESMRKFHRDKELDQRLDEALGPVTPKTPKGSRFCKCGCGQGVSSRARYTAACKKRVKRERGKAYQSIPGRPSATPKKVAGEQVRSPVKRCPVCADLSERREAICKGCDRAYAPERIGR